MRFLLQGELSKYKQPAATEQTYSDASGKKMYTCFGWNIFDNPNSQNI